MLLSLVTSAQTENRIIYTVDSYHNRDCRGGTGTCSETKMVSSTEKTTASIAKAEKNKVQLSLDKAGFSSKDWEELVGSKTFPINDENIKVDIELLRLLAIDPEFNTIKQGVYRVTVLEDKALIIFELVEQN